MNIFSKNQVNYYNVLPSDDDQRLDNLLIKILKGVPKSYIYRIIRSKEVKINNRRSDPSDKVKENDVIRIPPVNVSEPKVKLPLIPQKGFPILFEDEYFLIINKPSGVACHGGSGVSFGVIEQLRRFYPNLKFLELVHRLDRDTSGVLILAKKRQALVLIQEMIRNHQIKKLYLALTLGVWQDSVRNVKLPLYKYVIPSGERRVRVDKELGQFSHTIFKVLKDYKKYTLVEAELKTGRTHQIRVHLQQLGHPIIGDDKYGDFTFNKEILRDGIKGMFLHARLIEFTHPMTQLKLVIEANIPPQFEKFISKLDSEDLMS